MAKATNSGDNPLADLQTVNESIEDLKKKLTDAETRQKELRAEIHAILKGTAKVGRPRGRKTKLPVEIPVTEEATA